MQPIHHPHPADPPRPIKAITDDQLESLIAHVLPPRDKALFTLLADTGLRIGELAHLLVSDLLIMGNPVFAIEVRAAIAKTHKPRTIPLSPRAHIAITSLQTTYWNNLIDPTTHYAFYGKHVTTPISIRKAQRLCEHYGRSILNIHLTPHMLRHTFATRLMRKTNASIVQQLLGHATLSSTQIYTHPTSADLSNAISALSNSKG